MGRGREVMTYGGLARAPMHHAQVAVSHPAELVRGDLSGTNDHPLIRSFGPPSPQGEKGLARNIRHHATVRSTV